MSLDKSKTKKATKEAKKEMSKRHNKKKNEDSGSDEDDDFSVCSSDEEQMDELEYKKFLKQMFPSKHMDKKVAAGEKLKKAIGKANDKSQSVHNTRGSKKNKSKGKNSKSSNEVEEEEEEEDVVENAIISKKSRTKKPAKKSPKKKIEESSEDEDEDWEDCDEEDEADDVVELKGKSNKFNIIFTIGNGADEDEDEDLWEDVDEDDFDDEDDVSENEDDSVSSMSEAEEEGGEGEEEEEEEENKIVKKKQDNQREAKESKDNKTTVKDDEAFLSQLKEIYEKNKDSSMAKQMLDMAEESMKETKKKQESKVKKTQQRNLRVFRKIIRDKNVMNDFTFFEKMEVENQKKVIKELREINKITRVEKPYRLTLLEADMPPLFKGAAMKKINSLRYMDPGSGEYYKIKNWIDTFMRIPFGKFNTLPVSMADGTDACHEFMENAKNILDTAVYGLNDAKMQIMQMLGQLLTNPQAIGTAIAIHGPMGTGKTSIVKEGISKILNRPFAFIALGGATDSSFLEGHSYTYEGSTWGKIVQILIDSKCMNPVIYFDELDKISDTPKGEEIAGILTHLTDTSQNSQFHDKYYAEVDFDLSKCLFIFSYNDESKINPILRDRMYRIMTKGYDKKQKTVICNNHLLPKIREQVKFVEGEIIIPDDSLQYIMETHCNGEDGVRNMKRCLEIIHTKLNLYRLMKPGSSLFDEQKALVVEFPFTVTKDVIDKLITKERNDNMAIKGMYV
jgi:ATP-dependent Lon protease